MHYCKRIDHFYEPDIVKVQLLMYWCRMLSLLQALLKGAGKDGHTTVFLLTDTQIKQESFLEDVDGLLNAGEVANLYAIDEKQDIIEVRMCKCNCHLLLIAN